MDSDDDLYNDLPEETTSDYIVKIESKLESVQKQYDDSLKLIKELTAEKHKQQKRIHELEKKIENLERNASSLYRTAVAENKRKDNMLNELRAENDDLAFRRRENYRNRPTYCNRDKSRDHKDTRRRHPEDGSPIEEKYGNKSRSPAEDAFHSREMVDRRNRYEERQRVEMKLEKRSSSERNEQRSREFHDQEKHHKSRTQPTDNKEKYLVNSFDRIENLFGRSTFRVNEHRVSEIKQEVKSEPLPEELNLMKNGHGGVREKRHLLPERPNRELNDHRNAREKHRPHREEPKLVRNDHRDVRGKLLVPEKSHLVLHDPRNVREKWLHLPEEPNFVRNDRRNVREKQNMLPEKLNLALNDHHIVRENQQPLTEKPSLVKNDHHNVREKPHLLPGNSNLKLNDHRSVRENQQPLTEKPSLVRNDLRSVGKKPQLLPEKHNLKLKDHRSVRENPQPLPEKLSLVKNDHLSVGEKTQQVPGKPHLELHNQRSVAEKPRSPPENPNLMANEHRNAPEKQHVFPEKPKLSPDKHRSIPEKQQSLPAKSNLEQNIPRDSQEKLLKPEPKLPQNGTHQVQSISETETSNGVTNGLNPVNILSDCATDELKKSLHKTPAKNLIEGILSQKNSQIPCMAALLSMKKHPGKLLTPLKDTPDYLKGKFSQIENNKISAKIPMINEQRMLSPFKNVGIVEIVSNSADEEEEPPKTSELGTIIACSVTVSEDVEHGVFSRKSRKRPMIRKVVTNVKKVATN